MSHGSYNTYIASRRIYRTPESCIAEGPQGISELIAMELL